MSGSRWAVGDPARCHQPCTPAGEGAALLALPCWQPWLQLAFPAEPLASPLPQPGHGNRVFRGLLQRDGETPIQPSPRSGSYLHLITGTVSTVYQRKPELIKHLRAARSADLRLSLVNLRDKPNNCGLHRILHSFGYFVLSC